MSPTCFQLAFTTISFKTFLKAVESRFSVPGSRHQMYKTYTTGQLRIKTVFQNDNTQDSFHAFLFIFFSRVFIESPKFNSWGVENTQNPRDTLRPVFIIPFTPVKPRKYPLNEMRFSDRVRIENDLFHPYGSTTRKPLHTGTA